MDKKSLFGALAFVAAATSLPGAVRADDPAVNVAQDLRDLAATVALQKQIVEAQRAMLKSDMAATLPTGAIGVDTSPVLGSAATFAAYSALREIATEVCRDLGTSTYFASAVDLRDLLDQELAAREHLRYLTQRAITARDSLQPQNNSAAVAFGGAPGVLLALDAVGAVGKAIAGLEGFFKTERKIGTVPSAVDGALAVMAVRSCATGPTLIDPTRVAAAPQLTEVEELKKAAADLRTALNSQQAVVKDAKRSAIEQKQKVDDAKGEDKKSLQATYEQMQLAIAQAEGTIAAASAVLTVVDGALDTLHAVAATSQISPLIALRRMVAARNEIERKREPGEEVKGILDVKVHHASGYSQVSKAWWRSDRLDFAWGVAISYQVSDMWGQVERLNVFHLQTPWMRLEEGVGKASTELQRWRPAR